MLCACSQQRRPESSKEIGNTARRRCTLQRERDRIGFVLGDWRPQDIE